MAQMSFSVFKDRDLVRTVTLTGTDSDWRELTFMMMESFNYHYMVRLYFYRSGLEVRNVRFSLKENQEERIRMIIKERRSGTTDAEHE